MKFRGKIFSSYLLLALVFSGGFFACLLAVGPIERSFELLTVKNLPRLNLVYEIRTLGLLLDGELQEVAYLLVVAPTATTESALTAELAEVIRTRSQLLRDVEEYRQLVEGYFPEESAHISQLQMQVDQLVIMSKKFERIALDPATAQAQLDKVQFEELEEQFLAVTGEIASYELREIRKRREDVSGTVKKARDRIGLAYAVSLAAALLLAFLLTWRIARPVRALAAAADDFSDQRTDDSVETNRNDEFGQPPDYFNQPTTQIEPQNKEIDKEDR